MVVCSNMFVPVYTGWSRVCKVQYNSSREMVPPFFSYIIINYKMRFDNLNVQLYRLVKYANSFLKGIPNKCLAYLLAVLCSRYPTRLAL